jgi:hypothetical protein
MALGTFILMAGCTAQTGVVPTGQMPASIPSLLLPIARMK